MRRVQGHFTPHVCTVTLLHVDIATGTGTGTAVHEYKAWQFGGARKRAAILQKPCAFPQFCSQAFRPELPDACKIVRILVVHGNLLHSIPVFCDEIEMPARQAAPVEPGQVPVLFK